MGKFACCGNASQKVKYEGPDGKKREITVKNLQTLEKFGQGAAARNYTKQLKAEFVKDIASKCTIHFFHFLFSSFIMNKLPITD